MATRVYIGTTGWNYKHWSNGEFYPQDLKPSEWLKLFAERFKTVEINNSFYRLPSEAAFQSWRNQVPQDFIFAVKASGINDDSGTQMQAGRSAKPRDSSKHL